MTRAQEKVLADFRHGCVPVVSVGEASSVPEPGEGNTTRLVVVAVVDFKERPDVLARFDQLDAGTPGFEMDHDSKWEAIVPDPEVALPGLARLWFKFNIEPPLEFGIVFGLLNHRPALDQLLHADLLAISDRVPTGDHFEPPLTVTVDRPQDLAGILAAWDVRQATLASRN